MVLYITLTSDNLFNYCAYISLVTLKGDPATGNGRKIKNHIPGDYCRADRDEFSDMSNMFE